MRCADSKQAKRAREACCWATFQPGVDCHLQSNSTHRLSYFPIPASTSTPLSLIPSLFQAFRPLRCLANDSDIVFPSSTHRCRRRRSRLPRRPTQSLLVGRLTISPSPDNTRTRTHPDLGLGSWKKNRRVLSKFPRFPLKLTSDDIFLWIRSRMGQTERRRTDMLNDSQPQTMPMLRFPCGHGRGRSKADPSIDRDSGLGKE